MILNCRWFWIMKGKKFNKASSAGLHSSGKIGYSPFLKESLRICLYFFLLTHIDPCNPQIRLVQCNCFSQPHNCTLWCCSQFLTVIFFVAMLSKNLAHCLCRYAIQSKSQANSQHRNKKTLHSNHHHRFVYASIKTAWSYLNIMLPYRTFSPRL